MPPETGHPNTSLHCGRCSDSPGSAHPLRPALQAAGGPEIGHVSHAHPGTVCPGPAAKARGVWATLESPHLPPPLGRPGHSSGQGPARDSGQRGTTGGRRAAASWTAAGSSPSRATPPRTILSPQPAWPPVEGTHACHSGRAAAPEHSQASGQRCGRALGRGRGPKGGGPTSMPWWPPPSSAAF